MQSAVCFTPAAVAAGVRVQEAGGTERGAMGTERTAWAQGDQGEGSPTGCRCAVPRLRSRSEGTEGSRGVVKHLCGAIGTPHTWVVSWPIYTDS